MMSAIRALIVALCFVLPATAFAQAKDVIKVYAGANGIWFDGPSPAPSDFELGGNARASLSPHISVVGSGYYGLGESYFRGSGGVRLTATDVTDPDFSVGIGLQYQASTKPSIRPQEWAPDVSVGWKPFAQIPRLTIGAQGSYGLKSNKAYLIAAARYALNLY